MKILEQVKEFHTTFQQPIIDTAKIPNAKRCNLRVALIAEELKEFETAISNNDIIEAADALADLQYVLAGAVLEFGLGDKFEEILDEVHRSNMSKAFNTEQEAREFVKNHSNNDRKFLVENSNGRWFVKRDDDKLIKAPTYETADLKKILNS